MSLKAKIEAVIYASEDPVTLAQLVGLLGQEANAELDRARSTQQTLALENIENEANEPGALQGEGPMHFANTESGSTESGYTEGVATEAHLAEALDHALYAAAAQEAAASRAARHRTEADTAAMSSAEAASIAEPAAPVGQQGSAAVIHAEQDGSTWDQATSSSGEAASGTGQSGGMGLAGDARDLARAGREKERRLREYFRTMLDELIADYAGSERGLEIREVAGGYRLATKPEYHDAVRGFVKSLKPPLKLTLQALETLAVVAYKQPVTAPEISEIRGVDSGGVLGSLMARKLITTAGRKPVIGRPILYKTTRDFLLRFGLKDVNELPSIEEFEKMAGELAEQEEIPMDHAAPHASGVDDTPGPPEAQETQPPELYHAPETPADFERERDAVEPQADGSGTRAPADNTVVDDRLSDSSPDYDQEFAEEPPADSHATEAEIQSEERRDDQERRS